MTTPELLNSTPGVGRAGALVRPVTPSSTGSEPGNSFLHPAAP